jgi:hypothetical protein
MATGTVRFEKDLDRWEKHRATNYFDDMLQNKTLKLFQKYAVHAADNPEGYQVGTAGIRDVDLIGDFQKGAVTDDKLVSYVHLEKVPRIANYVPGTSDLKEGGDTIDCKASISPKPAWVPTYFLPWKVQSIVWMTIPRKGHGRIGAPDPDIFFTAAINGCSVFFQGQPQNPTIYHCGGDPDYRPNPKRKNVGGIMKPVRDPDEAATFWRSLVTAHGDLTKGEVTGEVNKTQYMMDTPTADAAKKTTARSDEYFKWLKKNNRDQKGWFRMVEVRPWGCVFGVRTGDDWQFYLQENATVRYTTVAMRSTHLSIGGADVRISPKTQVDVDYYDVARPMTVREIWPKSSAVVKMKHPPVFYD